MKTDPAKVDYGCNRYVFSFVFAFAATAYAYNVGIGKFYVFAMTHKLISFAAIVTRLNAEKTSIKIVWRSEYEFDFVMLFI